MAVDHLNNDRLRAAERGDDGAALDDVQMSTQQLVGSLLPPEGDFQVIIIDALGGNDTITVGPTVQKSVWIDAGAGNDRVSYRGDGVSNSILSDLSESPKRNDVRGTAHDLVADFVAYMLAHAADDTIDDTVITRTMLFSGLTIDNPQDVDWYKFRLSQPGSIVLTSASDLDGLGMTLYQANQQTGTTAVAQIVRDATDIDDLSAHDTIQSAYNLTDIQNIQNYGQINGLTLHTGTDVDVFHFVLDANGSSTDRIALVKQAQGDNVTLQLLNAAGAVVGTATSTAPLALTLSLNGVARGDYFVRVATSTGPTRYTLHTRIGSSANSSLDLSGKQIGRLTGLQAGVDYILKVDSPNQVPTIYSLKFEMSETDVVEVPLGVRVDLTRRDVIIGGSGDDVLAGGPGEDWIFGNDGNDVLSGGLDRNASDLLFGGNGDDSFQLLPDGLPFLNNSTETFIPTYNDYFDGGAGTDRVLFLGGDTGAAFNDARAIPDFVSLRWNRFLHRYEFTALEWDIANQQFVSMPSVDDPGVRIFKQNFAFYQVRDIEKTVIDTRAGDDVVRGDPSYKFPNVESEWGISPGDLEQHATIAGLEIIGGAGNDRLYGGAQDDHIDGGEGNDILMGGGGDDVLIGGSGNDFIVGSSALEPDAFEIVGNGGVSGRNDDVRFASLLPAIQPGSTITANFDAGDTGDWYLIPTPEALRQFGQNNAALLTQDMIRVWKLLPDGTLSADVSLRQQTIAYLFPAEDSDPGPGVTYVPRERFSGVPEAYLLHVTKDLAASTLTTNHALQFNGTGADRFDVPADPSINLTRTYTMDLWFRVNGNAGALPFNVGQDWMPIVFKGDNNGGHRNYTIWLNRDGYLHFSVSRSTGGNEIVNSSPGSIAADRWYHVAAVMNRDLGKMQLYLNGVLVGTENVSTVDSFTGAGQVLSFGQTAEFSSNYTPFAGIIDEVRLWKVARTKEQIQATAGRTIPSDSAGLVGYWRLEAVTAGHVANLTGGIAGNITGTSLVDGTTGNQQIPALVTDFGVGSYRIDFNVPLGSTTQVSSDQADASYSSIDLAGQPVSIPLGDIDGDGYMDAVVSVRDAVFDSATGKYLTFAQIAFGGPAGVDPRLANPPVTLLLPAPLLTATSNTGSVIAAAGDLNGDGKGDIAIAVTVGGIADGVYILDGRTRNEWSNAIVDAETGLLGEYFAVSTSQLLNYPDFNSLVPTHTRIDPTVNYPFTIGPGFAGFNDLNDLFGIRWTGQVFIDPNPATPTANRNVTFTIESDDGSRLFIDGQLVVDNGGLHPPQALSATRSLKPGFHDIRFEMFENFGYADAILSYDLNDGAGSRVIPAANLFHDARRVLDVKTGSSRILTGFTGPLSVVSGGNLFPLNGQGLLGEYFGPVAIGAQFPDVSGLIPVQVRIDPKIDFRSGADFGSFNTISGAIRWTGQINIPVSTEITISSLSAAGAALYIDGQYLLGVDAAHPATGANPGIHPALKQSVKVTLSQGLHDIRYLMYNVQEEPAAVLGWDLTGGDGFEPIPSANLLPARQVAAGVPARYDVLLVNDSDGTHFISGRTYTEVYREGTIGAANIGDFNHDGVSDVALLRNTSIIVRYGTNTFFRDPTLKQFGVPAVAISILPSIGTNFIGAKVLPAGDIDNDGFTDMLITGASSAGNVVVFGGAAVPSGQRISVRVTAGAAILLGTGAYEAVGDINGDGFGDLGAAALSTTSQLDETGRVDHQVVKVFLGRTRLQWRQPDIAPDLVIEPGRASFTATGTTTPQPLFFSALGDAEIVNGRSYSRLSVAGTSGDALRIYSGSHLALTAPTENTQVIGNDVTPRPALDTASGTLFVGPELLTGDQLDRWSIYAGEGTIGRQITPVLLRLVTGQYQIVAIGQTRTIGAVGQQTFAFNLQTGANTAGAGVFLGWKDGSATTDNAGVIPFSNSGLVNVRSLGAGRGTIRVGDTLAQVAVLNRAYSIQAIATAVAGRTTIDRSTDTVSGGVYLADEFPATGIFTDWTIFAGSLAAGRQITPLIIQRVGADYFVRGVGTTRTITSFGEQNFAFDLVSGSAAVGPGYYIGWKDGSPTADNAGVITRSIGAKTVQDFGGNHAGLNDVVINTKLPAPTAVTRTYAIVARSSVHSGDPIIDHAVDPNLGSLFVGPQLNFPVNGILLQWSITSGQTSAGHEITPLLFTKVGANYQVTGIGATRTLTGAATSTFNFDLQSGSAALGAATYLGWLDGSLTADSGGSVVFDSTGATAVFLGDKHGSAKDVALNASFAPVTTFTHTYSINAAVQFDSVSGNPMIARTQHDGIGRVYVPVNTPLIGPGTVTSWSFVGDASSVGRQITPLLYDFSGVLVGIGTTRTVAINGRSDFDFGLTAGTNIVVGSPGGQAYYFGWVDGTPALTSNPDVLPFTTSSENVVVSNIQIPLSIGQFFPGGGIFVARSYSVNFNVTNNTTAGNTLGDRGFVQAGGGITVDREFPAAGTMTSWSLFAAPSSVGRSITPLLLQRQPDGSYTIAGVGESRTITQSGSSQFTFSLQLGSDAVGPGIFFGWRDDSYLSGNTGGVITYTTGGTQNVGLSATPVFSGYLGRESVGGYAGIGGPAGTFSGQMIRNQQPAGLGNRVVLKLYGLPDHTSIKLSFLLAIIDSWDGNQQAIPVSYAPDIFNVTVDGTTIFSQTFTNVPGFVQSYTPPPGGLIAPPTADRYGIGYNDSAYDMSLESAFNNIAHSSPNLTVEFYVSGPGWEADGFNQNESFGLDNLAIILNTSAGAVRIFQENFDGPTLPDGSLAVGANVGPVVVSAARTYSVDAGTVVPIGNPITDSSLDLAVGGMFVGDEMPAGGRLTTWTMFAGAYDNSRSVTPLIFHKEGAQYRLVGIGRTRAVTPGVEQTFAFDLQSGSDTTGATYYFGWKDGATDEDNAGVIQYDNAGPGTVQYLGDNFAAAKTVTANRLFNVASTFSRTYSMKVTTEPIFGNALVSRSLTDLTTALPHLGPAFTAPGRLNTWTITTTTDSADRWITPIIFKLNSDGTSYDITGVGRSRLASASQTQSFFFDVQNGKDSVGPGYYLGWVDGSVNPSDGAVTGNTGVIAYVDTATAESRFFAGGTPINSSAHYASNTPLNRRYAIKANVVQMASEVPIAGPLQRLTYRFDLATPLPHTTNSSTGVDISNNRNPQIHDAPSVEGTSQDTGLGAPQIIGDVNGDGIPDLLVSGNTGSYILFGPVRLQGSNSVVDRAELVVDAALGRPAGTFSDINGDGVNDLVFVRAGLGSDLGKTFVTVIFTQIGTPGALHFSLPRNINAAWLNDSRNVSQVRVFVINSPIFSTPGASTHALRWHSPLFADLLIMAQSEQDLGVATGLIYSGAVIASTLNTYNNAGIIATVIAPWLSIFKDNSDPNVVATQLNYGGVTVSHSSEVQTRVVGDVNGDGLDDFILTNPGFLTFPGSGGAGGSGGAAILPPVGRAYLLLGREAAGSLTANVSAAAILQGVSFAGSSYALSDLNHDGYDDFAISGSREASDTTGGLFIYFGRAQYPNPNTPLSPFDATITITRDIADAFATGLAYDGALNATAGDFNGDGRLDLLVTEPSRTVRAAGSGAILDQDDRGTGYIFFSIAAKIGGASLQLTKADVTLRGDAEFDSFGSLPEAARIDLNSDGLDDLVIGAPGANGFINGLSPHAGKVYTIYGSAPKPQLPSADQIIELINHTVTGSGNFIVDNGKGRPEMFDSILTPDINSDGQNDFILYPDQVEHWFRFTTLGDGQPGSAIRLSPAAEAGLLTILPADYGSIRLGEVSAATPVNAGGSGAGNGRVAILEFDLSRFLAQLNDPTALEKIRLILSSPAVASVTAPVQVGGFFNSTDRVYFSGSDARGVELWASGGSSGDTYLVKDINPGAASSFPSNFVQVGSAVYFLANNVELWKTDGTANGTVRVAILPSRPSQLTVVGSALFFTVPAGAGTTSLYISDAVSTRIAATVRTPSNLTNVNGTLYFVDSESAIVSTRRIWTFNGVSAILVASQTTFDTPTELINANNRLAFIAHVVGTAVDREVFTLNGATWVQLSNVPGLASAPTGLTYANNRVYFAAEDAPAGTTLDTDPAVKKGRELWTATLVTPLNATQFNINGADFAAVNGAYIAWRIVNDYIYFFGTPLLIGSHLEPYTVTYTSPGLISSSSPSDFATAPTGVYFTADNGVSGRELYFSNGSAVSLISDIRLGSIGSNPTDLTLVGTKLFFSADNGAGRGLWVYDGSTTKRIAKVDVPPTQLEARGSNLFFEAGGKMWVSDGTENGTTRFDVIQPAPISMKISVLAGEGDDRVTSSDATRPSAPSSSSVTTVFANTLLPGQGGDFGLDITNAVLAALRDGKTRLTLRIENNSPTDVEAVNLLIATAGQQGGTRLEVTPRASNGVLGDLISENGVVIARGKAVIDMRALPAGTYYLRVYNPAAGTQTQQIPFSVGISAPIQGWTHASTDNDSIAGGDGDDLLMGNEGLDSIFGNSGRDRFIAEDIEVRDRETNESLAAPPDTETGSDYRLASPNPVIMSLIADPQLLVGFIQGLGLPITSRYDGRPLAHDILRAGDLAELITLDLNSLNISDLSGLEFATNLLSLNLAHNHINAAQLNWLLPGLAAGVRYNGAGLTGTPIGIDPAQGYFRHLAVDFNPISDLATIGQFTSLRSLSIDSVPVTNLDQLTQLSNLEVLSADGGSGETGLVGNYYRLIYGPLFFYDSTGFYFFDYGVLGNPYLAPLIHSRTDANINIPSVNSNFGGFSDINAPDGFNSMLAVRWTGSIRIANPGQVTFWLNSDDGSRLFIDGQLVVSNPFPHGMQETSGSITLDAGYHDVVIDYYNAYQDDFSGIASAGAGGIIFSYDPDGPGGAFSKQLVPTSILLPAGASPGVTNVNGIAGLTNLSVLSLSNNQIASVNPLTKLTDLRLLDLANNQISNIGVLTGLNNLERVHLDNNSISSLDALLGSIVIDNGDAGYTETPDWTHNLHPSAGLFERDYSFHEAADGSSFAEWTFSGLEVGAQYAVEVTWPAMPDSGSNAAKYSFTSTLIIHGLPVRLPLGSATVNQSIAPSGASFGGRPWQAIQTLEVPGSGTIHVRLNDLASGGVVAADGVRLVRVLPTGAKLAVVTARGNPLNDRAFTAVIPGLSAARPGIQIAFDNNAAPTITQVANFGSFGQAFRFDGSDDFARSGDLAQFFNNISVRPETIEFWFNAETAGVLVGEMGQTTPLTGFNLSLIEITAGGEIRVRADSGSSFIGGGTVSFGTWHHFALTLQDFIGFTKSAITYLDGVQQASGFITLSHPPDSGLPLYYTLGAPVSTGLSGSQPPWYRGSIDEFRVWNITRSAADISANFQRRLPNNETNMVAYFRFDDLAAGGAITDSSSTNRAGAPGATTQAPTIVTGVDLPNFAIPLTFSDTVGDTLTLSAVSSNPNVTVQIVGSRLLVNSTPNFIGTSTITVTVTDFNAALHDPRNRKAEMSFDVSIRANSIYGTRYWDRNGNNVLDPATERGVDGHLIFVDANGNGLFDKGEVSAYTDINGEYALRDIRLRSSPGGKAVVTALDATDPKGGMTPTTTSELAPFNHIDNITRTDVTLIFNLDEGYLFSNYHYFAVINLTPEATAGARNIFELASIINNLINGTSVAGHIFVQVSGNSIGFVTASGPWSTDLHIQAYTHYFTTRTTFYEDGSSSFLVTQNFNAPGGLGFQADYFASVSFSQIFAFGAPTTPDGGARSVKTVELPPFLRRDTTTTVTTTLKFTVDGVLLGSISLSSASVAPNASLTDLLNQINQLLTTAGYNTKVIASLEGDRLQFSTVDAGATKTLIVEVSRRFVSIRTTTRLDSTTFDETVADFTSPGGLGFAAKATATGNDQPQSNLDVYGAPRTDWIPSVAGDHLTPAVRGAGEIMSLNFTGRQAIDRNATDALIVNTAWSPEFAAALRDNNLNRIAFVAPGTSAPVLSLPWTGLNRIIINLPPALAEAVRRGTFAPLTAALTVTGMKAGNVAFTSFFDIATGALVLSFTGGLATDFYTVTLPGAASSTLGITGRGDAVMQFAVQPGDINNDGRTNDLDYFAAFHNNQVGEGDLRGDLNGDGLWNTADMAIVRSNYQKINPGAPAPSAKKGVALAPWLSTAPLASLAFSTSISISSEDILNPDEPTLTISAPDLSVTTKADLSTGRQ